MTEETAVTRVDRIAEIEAADSYLADDFRELVNAAKSGGVKLMRMQQYWDAIGVAYGEYDHDGSQAPEYENMSLEEKLTAVQTELRNR